MKPGKLYIKIFLSFLAVLFVTIMVIFALFHALPGKHFKTRVEDFTKTKALVIKETVEDKIRSAPDTALSKNESLKKFILDFGKISDAKIWLQNPDNTVAVKSFTGGIPEIIFRLDKKHARFYGDMAVYHQRGLDLYTVIPISLPTGERASIHVFFETLKGTPPLDHPEGIFGVGLFIIGLFAALLFIPVSRIITGRLNNLRQSALTIAEGNLSHRAVISGRDEIGELAQSFNQMADKLEMMIVNAKELSTNISHELRTPLTRIRIAEEILRDELLSGNAVHFERHLNEIREDIQELDQLINRILEWSKRDVQAAPPVLESFEPAKLIGDLLQKLQPVIDRKHLTVVSDLHVSRPCSGDKEALATAFSNILSNAAKYTPEKGRIHVRMQTPPDSLEVSIVNTFEKIPEEELVRIFVPFHRAKQAKAGGSGLGLAIAKKIVDRHGGAIGAYNAEEGFEIRISLPCHPSAEGPGEKTVLDRA